MRHFARPVSGRPHSGQIWSHDRGVLSSDEDGRSWTSIVAGPTSEIDFVKGPDSRPLSLHTRLLSISKLTYTLMTRSLTSNISIRRVGKFPCTWVVLSKSTGRNYLGIKRSSSVNSMGSETWLLTTSRWFSTDSNPLGRFLLREVMNRFTCPTELSKIDHPFCFRCQHGSPAL